jgi:hypothetical protein
MKQRIEALKDQSIPRGAFLTEICRDPVRVAAGWRVSP